MRALSMAFHSTNGFSVCGRSTNGAMQTRLLARHLFRDGRLLQQYVATQAARCDMYRAQWIRSPDGQKQMRAEEYGALHVAVGSGRVLKEVGKAVVCPSSERGPSEVCWLLVVCPSCSAEEFLSPAFSVFL